MKYLFIALLVLHGLIHLMGFAKGFQLAEIKELTLPVGKVSGLFWFAAFGMFGITAAMYGMDKPMWWIPAFAAVALSQVLIVGAWQDAKFGTIANGIILLVALSALFAYQFEQQYKNDVLAAQTANQTKEGMVLSEELLSHQPAALKQYLQSTNWEGKKIPLGFRADLTGQMRSKTQDWFSFTAEQYNFFEEPTRLFFMKAKMFGLPVLGYHQYRDGKASMDIRLLGCIPVVKEEGPEMLEAETVTFFNDMCLMAPGRLAVEKISWQNEADKLVASYAAFGKRIQAALTFDSSGALENFFSNDRMEINARQYLPFSTPIQSYQEMKGIKTLKEGEAVYKYAEGPFTYGKFDLVDLEFFYPKA